MIKQIWNKIRKKEQQDNYHLVRILLTSLLVIVGLVVLVIIFLWGTFFKENQSQNTLSSEEKPKQDQELSISIPNNDLLDINNQDIVYGSQNTPIRIIEYSDFECSFCAQIHPVLKRIVREYSSKVHWVYRHFPNKRTHPNAFRAAEAAQCAAEQGLFFEYADLLFKNQNRLGGSVYASIADQLHLQAKNFTQCMNSGRMKAKIEQDYRSGRILGISGTPTIFVNGRPFYGVISYNTLRSIINTVLLESSGT